jgi:hypothetical protein
VKHDHLMPRDRISIREAAGLVLLAAAVVMVFVPWSDRSVGLMVTLAMALMCALLVFSPRVRERIRRDKERGEIADDGPSGAGGSRGARCTDDHGDAIDGDVD